MGKNVNAVMDDGRMDELDSCAYTVLAALFSIIEEPLKQKMSSKYQKNMNKAKKKKQVDCIRISSNDDKERLKELLKVNGFTGKKVNGYIERILKNEKLKYFWDKAKKCNSDDKFRSVCADLLAHFDMANMLKPIA
jgi:hypothetical protein